MEPTRSRSSLDDAHPADSPAGPSSAPPEPVVPLAEELTPWLDPWDVCQRLAHLPYVLFFDSAAVHPALGRYSFVAADPFARLRARGRQVVEDDEGRREADPFAVLRERLGRWRVESIEGLPPFQGGAAGLFGYDLCHHIERLPRPRYDEFETPDLAVGFYDWVIAFDHAQ